MVRLRCPFEGAFGSPLAIRQAMRVCLVALLVFRLFGELTATAYAHANLVRAQPPVNGVARTPPQRVVLYYDDPLEPGPGFNRITVLDPEGAEVQVGPSVLTEANTAMTVDLKPGLKEGVYTVKHKVVSSSDGHNILGFYFFSIGEGTAPPVSLSVPGGGVSAVFLPPPMEAITNWLSLLSIAALVGGLFLTSIVVGAQGSERATASLAGLLRRLWRYAPIALLLFLLATVLGFTARAAAVVDVPLMQLFSHPGTMRLLSGSQYGTAILTRMALALAMVLFLVLAWRAAPWKGTPNRGRAQAAVPGQMSNPNPGHVAVATPEDPTEEGPALSAALQRLRRRLNQGVVVGALMLLTFPSTGHAFATAQAEGSLFPILMDWLHLLAVTVWLGGVFFLALVVLPLLRDQALGQRWVHHLIRRFSTWVIACVVVLMVTGIYAAGLHAPEPVPFYQSTYGVVLIAKYLLIVAFLLVGILARQAALDALRAPGAALALLLGRFHRLVRAEASLAALLLLAVGVLIGTAPPRQLLANEQQLPGLQVVELEMREAGDLRIGVTVRTSIAARKSAIDVYVTDAKGKPVPNAAKVTLGAGLLGADLGFAVLQAGSRGKGHYVSENRWFTMEGSWGMLVTVRRLGVAEDATQLFGVRVAGDRVLPMQYSMSAQPVYLGSREAEAYWGLAEWVQDATGYFLDKREVSDIYVRITDRFGNSIPQAKDLLLSAAPTGYADATFQDVKATPVGEGRFLVKDLVPDAIGAWTVSFTVKGLAEESVQGYFDFFVDGIGVTYLGGDYPPGHH